MMNRTSYTWGWLAAGTLTIFACVAMVAAQTAKPDAQTGAKPAKPAATKPAPAPAKGSNSAASLAFRNSVDTPPAGWKGPVFKMSRDYPKTAPKCDAPWLKRQVNFNAADPQWKDWEGYIQDIIDYVKAGQDPNLANGWNIAVGGQTRWYHVPWMAFDGERGREFVHGLTNELATKLSVFMPSEGRPSGKHDLEGDAPVGNVNPLYETWSIGMYNPCGGHVLGQVFPPNGEPATYTQGGKMFARGLPFPEGTVVMKILNTTADGNAVPYLKGSTNWQANGHVQTGPKDYSLCDRRVRDVHLVQIDLAVVDERSPTRWVYSTLSYDGTHPGKTIWDRLRPLGAQWGSDPGTFPAVTKETSQPLRETVLAPINIPEHYGCQKRLAGVVDQANSSCVSCHMGAYAAPPPYLNLQGMNIPPVFNFCEMCTAFNEGNKEYFSNYKYPATFPGNGYKSAIPLDSSLQLAVAFAQHAIYKNPIALPRTCPDAGAPPPSTSAGSR
jgi:hypothetical protein